MNMITIESHEQIEPIINDVFDEKIDLVYEDIFYVNGDDKIKLNDIIYAIAIRNAKDVNDLRYINYKEIIDEYKKYIAEVQGLIDSLKINDELLTAIVLK